MAVTEHTALTEGDIASLDMARNWVRGHFTEDADVRYAPLEGKLGVLDGILQNQWVGPAETNKLQWMGVALGDALAQKLMLDWVVVDDEHGRTISLHWPGTKIYCHPLTMISKRVEKGDTVDVHELFDLVCERLSEMAFSAK